LSAPSTHATHQTSERDRLRAERQEADERLAAELAAEDAPFREALRHLVEGIEGAGFRDELGQPSSCVSAGPAALGGWGALSVSNCGGASPSTLASLLSVRVDVTNA
jgi:hypothetical protein